MEASSVIVFRSQQLPVLSGMIITAVKHVQNAEEVAENRKSSNLAISLSKLGGT